MKKIIILGSLLGLLFTATSCREEFLNSEPTQTLAEPPAQAKLNGLYLMMVNTQTGGTSNHDDFGQKGYDIYSDILSSDMALGGVNYRWYRAMSQLTAPVDFTQLENYKPWRYYYRIAFAANDVIAGLGGNDVVPSVAQDKYAMGQAKAMRAYAYFYLSQFYNTKYAPAEDSVPLYVTASVEARPRAKQSEVYAQIVSDLTDAITLLNGFSRANKGVVNQDVAKGLLAYTYAAMGEDAKAATLAKEIIAKYPVTSRDELVYNTTTESGGGFNNLATGSWMWGFDLTLENGLNLVSWWGQADIFTYSYASAGDYKAIDLGLFNQIKTDDVRRGQFVTIDGTGKVIGDANTSGEYMAVAANKFYATRTLDGMRNITADYIFMRADEFHLLAAEGLAKSGNTTEAKSILKNFLSYRLNDTSYVDALSTQGLLDEIYLQTRIELWGEGKSYLAMKRNKATVTRGANHIYHAGSSFSYDDDRLTLDIPQQEVNNNPYITK